MITFRFAAGDRAIYCRRHSGQHPTNAYLIDSANGTVTDTRSGLMWDRCARGQSGPGCATGTATTLIWQGALDAAATSGTYKGFNDGRLPNVEELRSLVEQCRFLPTINEFAFPNTVDISFLSASPIAAYPFRAWGVSFGTSGSTVFSSATSPFKFDSFALDNDFAFFGWWAGNSFLCKPAFHKG